MKDKRFNFTLETRESFNRVLYILIKNGISQKEIKKEIWGKSYSINTPLNLKAMSELMDLVTASIMTNTMAAA